MQRKGGNCPHCGDKRFNNVKFADSERKRLRIDTPENIKASWVALQDERKRKMYSEAELRQMEERIINAWVQHISFEKPPMRQTQLNN